MIKIQIVLQENGVNKCNLWWFSYWWHSVVCIFNMSCQTNIIVFVNYTLTCIFALLSTCNHCANPPKTTEKNCKSFYLFWITFHRYWQCESIYIYYILRDEIHSLVIWYYVLYYYPSTAIINKSIPLLNGTRWISATVKYWILNICQLYNNYKLCLWSCKSHVISFNTKDLLWRSVVEESAFTLQTLSSWWSMRNMPWNFTIINYSLWSLIVME